MATTISQRIALEGGEEIKRQFDAIGAAAGNMGRQVEAAAVAAAVQLDRFVKSVANVEKSFASLGAAGRAFGQAISSTGAALGAVEGALVRTARNVVLLGAAVTGANVGLLKFTNTAADNFDQLAENAAGLGLTVEKYEALSLAAQDSGIKQEQFGRALSKLNGILVKDAGPQLEAAAAEVQRLGLRFAPTAAGAQAAGEAIGRFAARAQELKNLRQSGVGQLGDEIGKFGSVLQRLGINAIDPTTGKIKALDAVFIELAERISKLPDGAQKTKLLEDAFGRLGRKFADFVNKGGPGIQKLGEDLRKLSPTDAQIDAADNYNRALLILQTTAGRARDQLAILFAPGLTRLGEALTAAILRSFGSLRDGLESIVRNQIDPIIEDLIKLLNGDDANVQNKWIIEARDGVIAFGRGVVEVARVVGRAFDLIIKGANAVAAALNKIFGTEFSGGALLATAAILKLLGVFTLIGAAVTLALRSVSLFVRGLQLIGSGIRAVVAAAALLRFVPVALAGLTGPVGLAIVAGLAAIAAAFLLTKEDIVKAWTLLKEQIISITSSLFKGVLQVLNVRQDDTIFSWIGRAWNSTWVAIKASAPALVDAVKNAVALRIGAEEVVFGWIVASWNAAWKTITVGIPTIIEAVKNKIISLRPDGATIFGWIGAAWDFVWNDLISSANSKALELITAVASITPPATAFRWLKRAWDLAWTELILDAPAKLLQLAQLIASYTPPGLIFGWLKSAWDKAWEAITGTTSDNAQKAVEPAKEAIDELGQAQEAATSEFVEGANEAVDAQKSIADQSKKTADAIVNDNIKIVDALGRSTEAAKKLRNEIGQAKMPALGSGGIGSGGGGVGAGGGGVGGGGGGRSSGIAGLSRDAESATDRLKGLKRELIDLQTESRNLRRARLFPMDPAEFERAGKTLEENAVKIRRLNEDITREEARRREILEQQAFEERERDREEFARQQELLRLKREQQGLTPGGLKFEKAPAPRTEGIDQLNQKASEAAQGLDGVGEEGGQAARAVSEFDENLGGIDVDQAIEPLNETTGQLDGAFDQLKSAAESAAEALENIEASGDFSELAAGGIVRGPGTSTSDSILARLSRGEFVVRAAAVQHFGPKFFATLNALRVPTFNVGGFVGSLNQSLASLVLPRFASGAAAGLPSDFSPSSMTPLSLTFETSRGRRTFTGLQAPVSVARQIEREAIIEGYTRAGLPPSWDR